jgi:hypothetical protein
MRWLSLRALFLLGFAVGVPVLALPPVARRIDDLLYGPPPADFGLPPAAAVAPDTADRSGAAPAPPERPPHAGPPAADSAFQPFAGAALPESSQNGAAWPQLPQTPNFAPTTQNTEISPSASDLAGSTGSELAPTAVSRIHEETIARLQAIRQRLEALGADYVLVETLAEGGRYRFHCRMRIDADAPYTQPFEASSFDPVAAGEAVLQQVEQWRQARHAADPHGMPRR